MSVIQSRQEELRYLRRNNLQEESRVIGNYFKDIIHQYGIDIKYHKLNTDVFGNFNSIVDQNAILKHAYGYNIEPSYDCVTDMISYMQVEADVFQLQKLGMVPNEDVEFYFDKTEFACDFAEQLGQLKEYKIDETEIVCEVPDCTEFVDRVDPDTGEKTRYYLSDDVFPYDLGKGHEEGFRCGVLSGKLSIEIGPYEIGKEYEVVCHPYEHTDFLVEFPVNKDLYKSFQYKIQNDKYIDSLIFLTYHVEKSIAKADDTFHDPDVRYVLRGKLHGSILFYDLNKIGKYLDLIHPEVGDIITIDFPDENNREQYEITDCYDKQLTNDGISPLLHNYIWKCKARRYVNGMNEIGEENEANERLQEKIRHDQAVEDQVTSKVQLYDDGDQEAYGGYESTIHEYDKQIPKPSKHQKYDYTNGTECLDIMSFGCGSKLVTDGFDLIFIDADGNGYIVSKSNEENASQLAVFESGLKWIKASRDCIVFVSVDGESNKIIQDEVATKNEFQLCLEDLNEKTVDNESINEDGQNFIKFKNCRTYIWATKQNLYAKLESNEQLYKLI